MDELPTRKSPIASGKEEEFWKTGVYILAGYIIFLLFFLIVIVIGPTSVNLLFYLAADDDDVLPKPPKPSLASKVRNERFYPLL